MQWFLAKIVFRVICGDGNHTPQFDEQLRLVTAHDEKEAFEKAYALGAEEQDSFLNNQQQLVQWQFINIAELRKIAQLRDGIELYSHIEEKENAESYTELIHKKAQHLMADTPLQLQQIFQTVN